MLLSLPRLESLSLILPDRQVASILPALLSHQLMTLGEGETGLQELTILCRESRVINDKVISDIVSAFVSPPTLHTLALAGCSKLSTAPLLSLLSALPHLRHLALESCDLLPSFYASVSTSSLHSLKLTHPGPLHPQLSEFYPALSMRLHRSTFLRSFTLYHSGLVATPNNPGVKEWPEIPGSFIRSLCERVTKLRKFECSGVLMSIESFEILADIAGEEMIDLVVHLGYSFDFVSLVHVDM